MKQPLLLPVVGGAVLLPAGVDGSGVWPSEGVGGAGGGAPDVEPVPDRLRVVESDLSVLMVN